MQRLGVERAEDGAHLWTVDVAGSFGARLRGLMGRPALADGQGLYLPGTNSIHMLFMRFGIDCVFVGPRQADGRYRVLAVYPNLRPWRGVVWWVRGARGALELPAGEVDHARIAPGHDLRFVSG